MPPPLSPELLVAAYRRGLFPMAIDDRGTIGWFSPDPRAIIPLDDRFHVPHALQRLWKRVAVDDAPAVGSAVSPPAFRVTFDGDFERVMRECAKREEETWISEEIVTAYCALHALGHAHSVETRRGDQLVGGLYGVCLGGAFFGESMFHRVTDASKVALVALVERLRARGFRLLDTQWVTPHLARFGACEISRREYLRRLAAALARPCRF